MKIGRVLGATCVLVVLISSVLSVISGRMPTGRTVTVAAGPRRSISPGCARKPPVPPYVGVVPGRPWQASLEHWESATRVHPRLEVSYVPFGSAFDAERACQAAGSGSMLVVQINPRHQSIAAIAHGRYDAYLARYAHSVRACGAPVVISFAHEMNGNWYPWGYRRTPPPVFVAAWRRIHGLFTLAGAGNVIWLWDVNEAGNPHSPSLAPPRPWWPGSRYVDWVGVDSYYNKPGDTFRSVFGPTLREIRAFTHKPVLVAETAAAPGPFQVTQIHGLFRGIRAHRWLIGAVWFDISRREQWRLDNQPAAIAAFRAGVKAMMSGH